MLRTAPLWLFLTACAGVPGRSGELPPNVVLIFADDVGVEAFGCYGGTSYSTPNLDALAAEGMRFTHCYSQPLCTPSRVKLMTGKSNLRNYISFSILDPSERTFAHMAQDAGYATAVAGKWQLLGWEGYDEWAGRGSTPAQAGFDRWCLWQVEQLGKRYWDPTLDVDGELMKKIEGVYGPDLHCAYLLNFIAEQEGAPFFAYFPMSLVHDPFLTTPHSKASSDGEEPSKAQNFGDMVEYMDTVVGRIVTRLEELGLREDTLVLFVSDNGTHKSRRSKMGELVVRGGKADPTDAGTHVPLIASWPGKVGPGVVCDDLVDLSDFLPTLAGVMGAELSDEDVVDGRSFLPQLLGGAGEPREWVRIYSNPRPEDPDKNPRAFFARDKRYKLYDDGRFFDVVEDPKEKQPLAAEELSDELQEVCDRLQGALDGAPPEPPHLEPVR